MKQYQDKAELFHELHKQVYIDDEGNPIVFDYR